MNIALTSKSTGLASNYPIYLSYGSDFNLAATGMSGGQDATPPVYDAGTATVIITNNSVTPAVNYTTAAVTWGGSATSTASTLASNLASAINAAAGSIVTATANNGLISLWSKSTGAGTNYSVSVFIIDSQPTHFPSSSFSASAVNMSGGTATGTGYGTIYSNTVPQGGYAANGNLLAHTDSVMGTWGFGYDTLNRLTSAISGPNAPTSYANNYGCWSYDSFGNRTLEAFSSVTTTPCATGANDNLQYTLTTPTLANQVLGLSYGAAGNVLNDGKNAYLYDPEGRLCAVAYPNGTGGSYYEQYLYDAEGRRVAKGSVGSLTCAAPDAGFTLKNQYLLGQGGEQVTELNGAGTVQHTNAFIGGKLLATYDFVNGGLHFALTDPLGTRRVQVSGTGTPELNCLGLPFGNSLGNARATNCVPAPGSLAVAPDATEHHFTGKERDTESGNDYFGARYYASSMGRFMSPDWASNPQAVPYVDFSNPQSLNLFVYALNNPLNKYDLDGHDWRTYYQQAQKWAADHPRTMYAAKAVMVGTVTVAAAVVLVATLPVSAPATLVGAAVVGLSTAAGTIAVTGGAVATTLYAGAAITGNQDMANGAGPAQTLTNPSGFTGTVLSGGNMEVGGVAASVSDIATGDPVAAVSGAVDLTVNILNSASTQAGQDQIEMPPTDYYMYPDKVIQVAQTSQPK